MLKKKTLNPSLVPTPIVFIMFSWFWAISNFLVHFKWFQNFSSFWVISNLMGAVTRILQNVCLLHRQRWKIQDFKLKILNCFNSPNIKHRIVYTKHPHIFLNPFPNWEQFLQCWKHYVKCYKCSLSFRSRRTNVWWFDFLWFL